MKSCPKWSPASVMTHKRQIVRILWSQKGGYRVEKDWLRLCVGAKKPLFIYLFKEKPLYYLLVATKRF